MIEIKTIPPTPPPDFKTIVIGPGFDMRASIKTAMDFNALLVLESRVLIPYPEPTTQMVVMKITAAPPIEPITMKSIQMGKDESKHWSKRNRHNRKF
jgi:hypothetical protein